jgi:hypothetical protein
VAAGATRSRRSAVSRGPRLGRALCLGLGLVVSAFSSAFSADAARVVGTNGAPMIERNGTPRALEIYDAVRMGDVIVTDRSSKAKVLLADDSILAVGPGSRLAIEKFLLTAQTRVARLRVASGRFKLAVATFFGTTSDYRVHTPTAVTGVRGTVLWGDTDLDAICSLDGAIEVRSLKDETQTVALTGGQCVRDMRVGPPQRFTPTAEELAGYLREVTLE